MTLMILLINIVFFVLCYKSKSKHELIMVIFIWLYYIVYTISYIYGYGIDVSKENDTDENNLDFIILTIIFLSGYCFYKFIPEHKVKFSPISYYERNILIIIDILIIVLLMYELSLTKFNVLVGVYGNDTKFTYFFEYINILFALYIRLNKGVFNNRVIFYIICHISLALLDGHRMMAISSIMLLSLWYIIYIPKKSIPIVMLAFFTAFLFFGLIRLGITADFEALIGIRGGDFNNHHGSLIYSCLSIISFANSMSLPEKLILSSEYTLSLLNSASWLPNEFKYTEVFKAFTYRPGGGMLHIFFFSFFGYIGPFIAGLLIAHFLSFGERIDSRQTVPAYVLVAIALMPHYFSYTPILVFKAILFTFIVEIILNIFPKKSA